MAREAELAMDERFRPRGVQRNSKTAVAAARDAERALAAAEAAVVTATRNKAARDRVKARAGGRPRATPGRKIVVVDEDSDSLPGAARSRDRIPSSPSPSPRRAQSSARRTPPTAGRSPSLELSPSPAPAARAPVRATARAFRPSKNERAREYNDRLREREHRERLRRRERAVQAERAAAVQAGVSMADHLDSKLTARQRAAAIMRQVDAAQRNSETVAGIFVSYVAARKSGEEIDRRHAKDVVSMARSMPAFRALPPGHVADALAAADLAARGGLGDFSRGRSRRRPVRGGRRRGGAVSEGHQPQGPQGARPGLRAPVGDGERQARTRGRGRDADWRNPAISDRAAR